jgi:hypothetical protein
MTMPTAQVPREKRSNPSVAYLVRSICRQQGDSRLRRWRIIRMPVHARTDVYVRERIMSQLHLYLVITT